MKFGCRYLLLYMIHFWCPLSKDFHRFFCCFICLCICSFSYLLICFLFSFMCVFIKSSFASRSRTWSGCKMALAAVLPIESNISSLQGTFGGTEVWLMKQSQWKMTSAKVSATSAVYRYSHLTHVPLSGHGTWRITVWEPSSLCWRKKFQSCLKPALLSRGKPDVCCMLVYFFYCVGAKLVKFVLKEKFTGLPRAHITLQK